jgi:hypothetical protein
MGAMPTIRAPSEAPIAEPLAWIGPSRRAIIVPSGDAAVEVGMQSPSPL